MKKNNTIKKIIIALTFTISLVIAINGQNANFNAEPNLFVSPNVVISEVYGGGGNASATFNADYVELFNNSTTAISIAGWSVQYYTQAATTPSVITLPAGAMIQPGGYYLIQTNTAGATGVALPTPDFVSPTVVNLNGTQGKILLANDGTAVTAPCPASQTGNIVDKVGYGTTAVNCNETANAPSPANNASSITRTGNVDTDNNSVDFTSVATNPQNSNVVTAAPGTITGRARTSNGRGIKHAVIMLTGGNLESPIYATTNQFGYYQFQDVGVGQSYALQINSGRYSFQNSSRVINLDDNLTDEDFIADSPGTGRSSDLKTVTEGRKTSNRKF